MRLEVITVVNVKSVFCVVTPGKYQHFRICCPHRQGRLLLLFFLLVNSRDVFFFYHKLKILFCSMRCIFSCFSVICLVVIGMDRMQPVTDVHV